MRDCLQCEDLERRQLVRLQHEALEDIARGRKLKGTMIKLCRRAEQMAPGIVCSILGVVEGRRLRTVAAPSLPLHYCRAIDGLEIGPTSGSCGAAAYHGRPVLVSDIVSDPIWADFRRLATPLGLKACWSTPIVGQDGGVLGAFAFYFREARGPGALERAIVEACVRICSIAMEREQARLRLKRLAFSDHATGLPNRAGFMSWLERAFASAAASPSGAGRPPGILLLEVGGLGQVNDDWGPSVGDQLLVVIAERLQWIGRRKGAVARISGGKFAFLLRAADIGAEIGKLAERLTALFARPFDVDGRLLSVDCSIGAAMAPQHGDSVKSLLKAGETALRHAQGVHGSAFLLYDPEQAERERETANLARDIKQAIANDAFELHYQPFVDLSSSEVVGFEALARWRHPRLGPIAPMEFITLAEKTGLIIELSACLLRKSLAAAATWPASMRLAVNISALHLRTAGFMADLVRVLRATRLDPARLELELTESALLADDPSVQKTLRDIRRLGVTIALDDFGTGYSALSYLHKFPIDRLKIDRSFVAEMMKKPRDRSIVRAILNLADELGIRTTAEGVETAEQLEWLREAGCSEAQGYLLGRPAPQPVMRSRHAQPCEYRAAV